MDYIMLSKEQVEERSIELYDIIRNSGFLPTAVVYIARGGYPIGRVIAEHFNVPLFEARAVRSGGKLKSFVAPLLRVMPQSIKQKLREREVSKGTHSEHSERKAELVGFDAAQAGSHIIIVDDAVDTGHSMKAVQELILGAVPTAVIKHAAINCISKSFEVIKTDYFIYKDCLVGGPWSNDSPEHKEFLADYDKR